MNRPYSCSLPAEPVANTETCELGWRREKSLSRSALGYRPDRVRVRMPESTLRFHCWNECTTLYAPTAFRHATALPSVYNCRQPEGFPVRVAQQTALFSRA